MPSAGDITGGISLGLQGLKIFMDGYHLVQGVRDNSRNFGEDAITFSVRLKLLQARLRLWRVYWGDRGGGLSQCEDKLREAGHWEEAIDAHTKIERLVKEAQEIAVKNGMESTQVISNDLPTEGPPQEAGQSEMAVQSSAASQTLEEAQIDHQASRAQTLQRSRSLAQLLSWATNDRTRFNDILLEIVGLTDRLDNLIPSPSRLLVQGASTLEVDQLDAAELASIVSSSERETYSSSLRAIASLRSLSISDGLPRFVSSFELKISLSELVDEKALNPIPPPKPTAGEGLQTKQKLSIATYQNQEAVIEWRDLDEQWRPVISRRAEDLARTLGHTPKPPEFRTLNCLGFVEQIEKSRLGFVYSVPPMSKPLASYHTLRGLYDVGSMPYLGDRFRLAQHILLSMMHFHNAGWLHREFRSENIVFFSDENLLRLEDPYVMGFENSRPDHRGEETLPDGRGHEEWLIYRHPSRRSLPLPRFERKHDLYSLGLVLLEIGLWKPVKLLLPPINTQSGANAGDVEKETLKKWVKVLGSRMGEIYMKVVHKCLVCGEESDRDEDSATSFYVDTVWALSRCSA